MGNREIRVIYIIWIFVESGVIRKPGNDHVRVITYGPIRLGWRQRGSSVLASVVPCLLEQI